MTKPDKTGQLSIEQQNAIDLLIQGKSDRETAELVGVTRQTVTGWRNEHALFAAELNQHRQEVWGSQVERLRGLVSKAVDTIEANLDSEDDSARQRSAEYVLKAVGLHGANLKPKGATTAEDVQKDWSERAVLDSMRFPG